LFDIDLTSPIFLGALLDFPNVLMMESMFLALLTKDGTNRFKYRPTLGRSCPAGSNGEARMIIH
jgi:hypothetical protein